MTTGIYTEAGDEGEGRGTAYEVLSDCVDGGGGGGGTLFSRAMVKAEEEENGLRRS